MTTNLKGSQKIAAAPKLERGENLSPAARRALEEAAARRSAAPQSAPSDETGGRAGLEPTRYGDWERNGLASDF